MEIRKPAAGQVPDHGRSGPAGRRVHGDADRLVDHDDGVVVVDDLDALDDLGDDLERVGRRPGSRRRASRRRAPGRSWRRRPRRPARGPRAISSAARVRERPNIRAMRGVDPLAGETVGDRDDACSRRVGSGHDRRSSGTARGARRRCRMPAERLQHDQRRRDVDADVGDVEDRPVRQHQEVDDVAAQRRRVAEEPVGQVAGDAGRAGGRGRPPRPGCRADG